MGYELEEIGRPKLEDVIRECLDRVETPELLKRAAKARAGDPKGGMKKAARKAARVTRGRR